MKAAIFSEPDLLFRQGDFSGFTSSSTTSFGLNAAIVIRELIQNSLDAVQEVGRDTARVRFEVKMQPVHKIPGIKTYRQALKKAIADQKRQSSGKLPDHAKLVIDAMTECLAKKQLATLYVLDNGIGLDNERMKGLLADGLSVKTETNTGAFGNGHMAVIPASDLRYILYGGLSKQGNKDHSIASGHAVLASREGKKGELLSKDGFFLKGYTKDFAAPYNFPSGKKIPEYIGESLQWIKKKWKGSGSVVIIPGFNYFGKRDNDDKLLWNLIEKAAAWNFFTAIHNGKLVVEYYVHETNDKYTLDGSNIYKALNEYSEERKSNGKFLSGAHALSAYETIKTKEKYFTTEIGKIPITIRELPSGGRSRIDLCRNGMWITDSIPSLKPNSFSSHKPFHCALLIESNDGEIHQLIRKMESPLHDNLNINNLLAKEKSRFREAMRSVVNQLKKIIPENDSATFIIDDFLTIRSNNFFQNKRWSAKNAIFKESPSHHPKPQLIYGEKIEQENYDQSQEKNYVSVASKKQYGNGSFRRTGNPVLFQGIPVPTGNRSCRISLFPQEKCIASEFRLVLDEGLDGSCDEIGSDTFLRLKNIKINEKIPSINDLMKDDDGHILAVKLGELQANQKTKIETDYIMPEHAKIREDTLVVVKTHLIRRAAPETKENI